MKLISFRIKNFKSIIDTGVCKISDSDNIVILAGQNESGKTAVLQALDFFANGTSADFEKLHRRQEESPEVACNFLLSDEDIENIFIESNNNEKLKSFLKDNPTISFMRGNAKEDDFDDIRLAKDTKDKLENLLKEISKTELENKQTIIKDKPSAAAGVTDITSSAKLIEIQESIFKIDDLEKIIIPEIRKFTFYTTFSDLLPGEVKIADIKSYAAVLDFEKVFDVNFSEIIKKDSRTIIRMENRLHTKASDDLNTYWGQELEEGGKYNFTVKIEKRIPDTESLVQFTIDRDDGDPLFLEQKSQGFRWFSSFNLRLRALGVNKDNIKNLVILIDEPGQGLHEKAQADVKRVIEELANNGAQIIYSTHNPNLIGTHEINFTRIRLVSNDKKEGTKVRNVSQFLSQNGKKNIDALSPIRTAMGLNTIQPIFDDRNRYNVIVEGITDNYYFNAFKKLFNYNERLFFIPSCGVDNVVNVVSLLIGWGCDYKAVLDDDKMQGRKVYDALKKCFFENDDDLAHKYILKIKDCHGIEDIFSQDDFIKYILNRELTTEERKINNSEIVKNSGKEMYARLFLEKVQADKDGKIKLNKKTMNNIKVIFDWLYDQFNIKSE